MRAERARREAQRQRRDVENNADAIRARCATLAGFVREAWHVLEPVAPYVHNWHIDVICRHLEAATRGEIPRLLINIPPGCMKSLLVSVFWPAWEWGPAGLSALRYIATSFNDVAVLRDSRKTRDLVMSEWYRGLWPEIVLTREAENDFANTATGGRKGVPFGSLTGQRGDRLCIDDPHSIDTAESDAERDNVTRRFRERAIFSVNDIARSVIVVVMQRLHQKDISGVIQALGMDFVKICLPMEFEVANRCETVLGVCDPRTYEGELLDPIRWPRAELEKLWRPMGPYAKAGQFQQRPVPREGGMFKREWFAGKYINAAAVPAGTVWVRHWDLAASTRKTSARTAGVKMGRTPSGRYIVAHSIITQSEGSAVRVIIKATAESDGKTTKISLPQDPGQAGKVQKSDYIAMLAGYDVRAEPESGDKETRAEPFSAQCEGGNVSLVIGSWNEPYLDELCMFPSGMFKDQVDASSGAFGRLVVKLNRTADVMPFSVSAPRNFPG